MDYTSDHEARSQLFPGWVVPRALAAPTGEASSGEYVRGKVTFRVMGACLNLRPSVEWSQQNPEREER